MLMLMSEEHTCNSTEVSHNMTRVLWSWLVGWLTIRAAGESLSLEISGVVTEM